MDLFYLSAGSSRWGTGHLLRSIELIDVLKKNGLHVSTVALVPDKTEMQQMSAFIKIYDRHVYSLSEIGTVNADGIVVDVHTDFQPEVLPWLKKQGLNVVAVDWYYDNGGVITARANLRGGPQALKYALIRKEFHDALRNRSCQGPKYDAVVVMGGGDRREYLYKIFQFFSEEPRFLKKNIVIVLGPMVKGKITELAGSSFGAISIARNPADIADIMAGAAVGITNGGTSLMEFTMLGIPTIIFTQTEEEDNFIQPFLESGCSVSGANEHGEFARQITELLENEILRKIRAEKARKLIDGHGAKRITDLIFKTFLQKESNIRGGYNESQDYKKN